LAQVLTNLLDNAAKYTQRGGCIEVEVTRRGSNVEIRVRDDGPGVRPADLPHLFEPLFRAAPESDGGGGGLGLGLPLAAQLMRAMGGDLECLGSAPGRGAEFKVTLPFTLEEPAGDRASSVLDVPKRVRRVLVVDDDSDVGDSFRVLLRAASLDRDLRDIVKRQWLNSSEVSEIGSMTHFSGRPVAA